VARYSHKGNKLAVTGSLQNRSYEDSNGNKRTATDIQVQDVEFLTPRQQYDDNGGGQGGSTNKHSKLEPMDDDGDIPF
jgi:single-strand DNA-binding protein